MTDAPLLLVDGHNLVWRAAFGFPAPIYSRDKTRDLTGVFGFFALLRVAIRDEIPDPPEVIVVFDGEYGSAARKETDPSYKANRVADETMLKPIRGCTHIGDTRNFRTSSLAGLPPLSDNHVAKGRQEGSAALNACTGGSVITHCPPGRKHDLAGGATRGYVSRARSSSSRGRRPAAPHALAEGIAWLGGAVAPIRRAGCAGVHGRGTSHCGDGMWSVNFSA
ncbi:hypothetical protein [Microtetraspora malaysiensis]|uniref:5'-3' exonuclease alpha-helical arch N-terminal domain-containing protein n=1 Tax=Microtetraspora malaysiensis TaxID=161358 RepID=A0ABW6SLT1_9ACTN